MVREHFRDHHGHMQVRHVRRSVPVPHYMPGGRDGRDGQRGGEYTYPLYPGKHAKNGQYTIYVQRKDGTIHPYDEAYRLNLAPVRFSQAEGAGVFEPGDEITAHYRVNNASKKMPSPPEDMPIIMAKQTGIEAIQQGKASGGIKASEGHETTTPVTFKFSKQAAHTGTNPYKATYTIASSAWNTRLGRAYQGAHAKSTLTVQYPLQMVPKAVSHFSVAAGESLEIKPILKNISSKPIGYKAGRKAFIRFTNDKNDHVVEIPVDKLDAQTTSSSYGLKVRFDDETGKIGSTQRYTAGLYLEPVKRGEAPLLVQQQHFSMQLTEKHTAPRKGFTLVVNAQTPKATIQHWKDKLKALSGEDVSIWNTSYYQSCPYQGRKQSLLKDASSGTLVILDNPYTKSEQDRQHKDSESLTWLDRMVASRDTDTSIVVVGETRPFADFTQSVRRGFDKGYEVIEHDSKDALFNQLLLSEWDSDKPVKHRVKLPASGLFGKYDVDEQKKQLESILQRTFPARHYHVKVAESTEGHHQLEVTYIGRYTHVNQQRVVSDEREAMSAMPTRQKMSLLKTADKAHAKALSDLLLNDLLEEQAVLRTTELYGNFWQRLMRHFSHDFSQELKLLNTLSEQLADMAEKGEKENLEVFVPHMMNLIAKTQFYVNQQKSFWLWLASLFSPQPKKIINQTTQKVCDQMVESLANLTEESPDALRVSISQKQDLVAYQAKLKNFIDENKEVRTYALFFKTKALPPQDLEQLQWLNDQGLEMIQPHELTSRFSKLKDERSQKIFNQYLTLVGLNDKSEQESLGFTSPSPVAS